MIDIFLVFQATHPEKFLLAEMTFKGQSIKVICLANYKRIPDSVL